MITLTYVSQLLVQMMPQGKRPGILFLTGSSGCGKTYLAQALEKRLPSNRVAVKYFDRIGVPSLDEMQRRWGSPERWQQAATDQWVRDFATIRDKALVIFEGQYHPRFAVEAAAKYQVTTYKLAVVTAEEAV